MPGTFVNRQILPVGHPMAPEGADILTEVDVDDAGAVIDTRETVKPLEDAEARKVRLLAENDAEIKARKQEIETKRAR